MFGMFLHGIAVSTKCQPLVVSSAPHGAPNGNVVLQKLAGSSGTEVVASVHSEMTRVLLIDRSPRSMTCTYARAGRPRRGCRSSSVPGGHAGRSMGQLSNST